MLLKNKLRNRIRTQLLCSLIYIKQGMAIDKTCCKSYNIPKEILDKIGKSEKYQTYENEAEDHIVDEIMNDLQLM